MDCAFHWCHVHAAIVYYARVQFTLQALCHSHIHMYMCLYTTSTKLNVCVCVREKEGKRATAEKVETKQVRFFFIFYYTDRT